MNSSRSSESFNSSESTQLLDKDFIGFNLADFSLTPIVRKGKGKSLVNTQQKHKWSATVNGKDKEFYVNRIYGMSAPNAYTEDFLVLLATMAHRRSDPTKIPVSATEFLKVQGYTSLPGGNNVHRVINHLDALQQMTIQTNALYNRDTGKWYGFKGSPVGGYTFKDDEGRIRSTTDKNGQKVEIVVRELGTTSITPEFYEAFLQDVVPIDLNKYFNVGGPTARRLYKMGIKYVQNVGDYEIDLQECCLARLGMLPEVVLIDKVSKLASDVRAQTKKVTEVGDLNCVVEKSKTASGYKVCFRKNVTQLSIPGFEAPLKGTEKKAYTELAKRKVNSKLAHKLVIEARRRHGRRAGRFISFVLKSFDKDSKVGPGVLKHRIMTPVFYDPAFADYLQAQRVKEGKRDAKKYAEGTALIRDLFDTPSNSALELKETAPETYTFIKEAVERQYSTKNAQAVGLSEHQLEEMRLNAMNHYLEETLRQIKRGNSDYRPEI